MTAPAPEGLGLTAAQEPVWLAQRLAPTNPHYNAAEYIEIRGPLDVPALEAAVRATVTEADALNMRFVEHQGRLTQHPRPAGNWPFPVVDLRAEPDPLHAAERWMAEDLDRLVDLTIGPVFGHALLVLTPEHHLWYHRCHHIALDGYGFFLIAQRVAQRYSGLGRSGRWFGTLREVVADDHAYQLSPRREVAREFWRARFADHDHRSVASFSDQVTVPSGHVRRHRTELPAEVRTGLRRLAGSAGINWADLVLAVVARQLHRRTGATEVVLGWVVMGRLGTPAARTPAMVTNIVPMRITVPGEDLLDIARSVADEQRAVHPHVRYRGEHLRRDLRLLGGARRLFGPVVNVLPFDYDLKFGASRGDATNVSTGAQAIEDIVINLHVRADRALDLDLDANPACYDQRELAALADGLAAALVEAAQTPPPEEGQAHDG